MLSYSTVRHRTVFLANLNTPISCRAHRAAPLYPMPWAWDAETPRETNGDASRDLGTAFQTLRAGLCLLPDLTLTLVCVSFILHPVGKSG